jgi:hypothetical protein
MRGEMPRSSSQPASEYGDFGSSRATTMIEALHASALLRGRPGKLAPVNEQIQAINQTATQKKAADCNPDRALGERLRNHFQAHRGQQDATGESQNRRHEQRGGLAPKCQQAAKHRWEFTRQMRGAIHYPSDRLSVVLIAGTPRFEKVFSILDAGGGFSPEKFVAPMAGSDVHGESPSPAVKCAMEL